MPITTPQKPGQPHSSSPLPQEPSNLPRLLLRPQARKAERKKPLILFCAAVCFLFALLLIAAGVATLVVFLIIKPRNPRFDVSGATLNAIYLDSPTFLNGDFTFLANFSNPNEKLDVKFQYAGLELFFSDSLIAAQALKPFSQRRGEVKLESVHMVTSEVFLSPEIAGELREQVSGNRVMYTIRGTFKVTASLGFIHVSYWLYGLCTLELSQPPSGVLLAKSCRTRR